MRNGQTKQSIYIRNLSALMAVYLIFMLCFSIFYIRSQDKLKMSENNIFALFINMEVQRSIENYIDHDNNIIDPEKVQKSLQNSASLFENSEAAIAVYSGDYDLLYSTSGGWICSYTERIEENTYYAGYGMLKPLDWFSQDTVNEMAAFLNAQPKAKQEGDLSGYSLDLEGFWIENGVIIPEKIIVSACYADSFNEQGEVSVASHTKLDEYLYVSGYENTKNLPYFEHGNIQLYVKSQENQNEIYLREMVQDKERLIRVAEEGQIINVEKENLFSKRIYMVRPYQNLMQGSEGNPYYSPVWTVLAWEVNVLSESMNTLSFIWLGCLAVFAAVAIILSEGTYKTLKKSEAIERQRIDTANALAHELKTPLSIVSGYAQSLYENIQSEKREYYADKILENISRMDNILQEMLETYRLNLNVFMPKIEDVSLREICLAVFDRYIDISRDKQIKTLIIGDTVIKADRILIERVIDNFFVNAINSINKENETIKVIISQNKLMFYNSGSYIPEEKISEIWQTYKKINIFYDKNKSTGLGLSIVRMILELHGFHYGAENENDGVTFWFSF